jgi:predicted ATPase/DNA-binding winged helix-turn-helix (wHTH) protein
MMLRDVWPLPEQHLRKLALASGSAGSVAALDGDPVFAFGPFELHPRRRLLFEEGRLLRLGSRAFDILVVLVQHAGEVVGKDDLIAAVWPNVAVEDNNLRVHIAALRRALGDGHSGVRFVANVPGRGYCFVGPVATRQDEPHPVPSRATVPSLTHAAALPALLTRVIGRTAEIGAIQAELPRRRFVTVVGPGGIGKTTVALAAAERLAPSYRDGCIYLDLAPVTEPTLLPAALASALKLSVRAEAPTAALTRFLRDKALLLVLDGCEPLLEAAATLTEVLLRASPAVNVLATSREPLRAAGEWIQRVPPLAFPPASPAITGAEALHFPAVQLFVRCAAAAKGGFELRDTEVPAITEICRKLDGIALAIELAAGRMDAFGPIELAALLNDRFRILTRGRRTALPHHRTLRATLDWSVRLLSEAEQAILRRLSVFNGSFVLAAAVEVGRGGTVAAPEIGDLIASLVEKSLVVAEPGEPEVRYRLLETTRVYARERLDEAGEAVDFARRHAEHYCTLFEQAEAAWQTCPTSEWLTAYAAELDNLRAALDWAFSPGGDAALAVALTAAAVPLWFQLSLVDEGLGHVERALAMSQALPRQDERRNMRLHAALGWLSMYSATRTEGSARAWKKALDLADDLRDEDYQLRALWALWADRQNHGEFRDALALARRFRALAAEEADRLVGDRMTGASLHFLGDQGGARECIEVVLRNYRPPERRSHAVRFQFDQRVTARITLGRILLVQGFPDQAMREVEGNIADALSSGHALSLCNALAQAACPVALLVGDLEAAERFSSMLRRHTTEHALDIWRAYVDCFDGELLVRRGEARYGLTLLLPAVEELRRADFAQHLTFFLGALAEGLAAVGRSEDALHALDEALARCERTGERWYVPELHRLRGETLIRAGAPIATAEAAFLCALSRAREQCAPVWELRASTSLAAAWRSTRAAEARHLLASALARLTEGFGAADTLRANVLLRELDEQEEASAHRAVWKRAKNR